MYLGTQIRPRDDADYRVWAQLGVRHVCVDPPGDPHHWSLDDLNRHREHVESFGLSLDMVQLPLSSRPIEEAESPHILLGKEPERQREIDSICGLIERLATAGIPAAKYNLSIIGIPRTEREPGRGGSRNAAFRWSRADQTAPPTQAGIVSEEENWERIHHFLRAVIPVATAAKIRLACHPHDPYT
ncbi:MAG: mannonate dehydratase, partial [Stellaceae bacterium]